MKATLNNISEPQALRLASTDASAPGYQPLKLLNIYHRDYHYHVRGPFPITCDVEAALRLWMPELDPDFLELHQFTYLAIRADRGFRFFEELLAVWKGKGGGAITLEDATQALANSRKPARLMMLSWGAETRYGGV